MVVPRSKSRNKNEENLHHRKSKFFLKPLLINHYQFGNDLLLGRFQKPTHS